MTINFYYNNSDRNVVDKSLSSAYSTSAVLKDNTSVTDPVVLVNVSNPSRWNYMHIPEFGRYYFIMEITSVREGLWAITGHVDVLQSYANEIHSQSGVLARSESWYNLYLDDDKFLVTARRKATTLVFPGGPEGGTGGKTFAFIAAGSP